MQTESTIGPVALALQGGGAHGAFASGVLDYLLENGLRVDRICGASSGALLGTMFAQGWVTDGAAGARRAIRRLWQRVVQAHKESPGSAQALIPWFWDPLSLIALGSHEFEAAIRMLGPTTLNPLGLNPLRAVVSDLLEPALLADPAAPRLTVGATDVNTGEAVLFGNQDITVDVLLASCCLPLLWPAVEIDGRTLWDGGFSGNPPLAPLLSPGPPDKLILIRAQPRRREGVPKETRAILNRIIDIACERTLEAELAALPQATRIVEYDADATLASMPGSSRLEADSDFLGRLFAEGRKAARAQKEREAGTAGPGAEAARAIA